MDLKSLVKASVRRTIQSKKIWISELEEPFPLRSIETTQVENGKIIGNCYHSNTSKVFFCDGGNFEGIMLRAPDGKELTIISKRDRDDTGFDTVIVPKGYTYALDVGGGVTVVCLSDTLEYDDVHAKTIMEYD